MTARRRVVLGFVALACAAAIAAFFQWRMADRPHGLSVSLRCADGVAGDLRITAATDRIGPLDLRDACSGDAQLLPSYAPDNTVTVSLVAADGTPQDLNVQRDAIDAGPDRYELLIEITPSAPWLAVGQL